MIVIDQEKCNSCGLCVKICHESGLSLQPDGLHIDREVCSTCTQCIAICPRRAVTWDGLFPQDFERKRLPEADQLDELFRERRSIRLFKPVKIERDLLAEIVQRGNYAPTHNFHLRAIVVDGDEAINELDRLMVDNCRRVHRWAYQNRLIAGLAVVFGYQDEMCRARPKIEAVIADNRAFHSRPAALILIAGDRKTPLSEASAQYALANMMYYAQLKGVGTCLWGNASIFIDKNRVARQRLGVRKGERIYGGIYMGYPAVRFTNKVDGRVLGVEWV